MGGILYWTGLILGGFLLGFFVPSAIGITDPVTSMLVSFPLGFMWAIVYMAVIESFSE